jgi:hypothetical protein
MTLDGRRKLFKAAVITLNVTTVFWALIDVLEGMSVSMSVLYLLLRLALLNGASLVLWRGGELSQNHAKKNSVQ